MTFVFTIYAQTKIQEQLNMESIFNIVYTFSQLQLFNIFNNIALSFKSYIEYN